LAGDGGGWRRYWLESALGCSWRSALGDGAGWRWCWLVTPLVGGGAVWRWC
ncbi:hypothetical protein BDD12DRAFT_856461, partial [Trichophaea hybrida]